MLGRPGQEGACSRGLKFRPPRSSSSLGELDAAALLLGVPGWISWASIPRQPSIVTRSGLRSASSSSICSRAGFGGGGSAREILGEAATVFSASRLLVPRIAVGPRFISRPHRRRVAARRRQAGPCRGRWGGRSCAHRGHVGQRHRPVADRAQDEAALDRLTCSSAGVEVRPPRPAARPPRRLGSRSPRLHTGRSIRSSPERQGSAINFGCKSTPPSHSGRRP